MAIQEDYKDYFDSMPCYLSVQDRDLKIIDANDRFVKNFGDPSGRYCYQVYKRRPEKCEDCPVERTFRDGRRHRSEQLVHTLDGRDVSVKGYEKGNFLGPTIFSNVTPDMIIYREEIFGPVLN